MDMGKSAYVKSVKVMGQTVNIDHQLCPRSARWASHGLYQVPTSCEQRSSWDQSRLHKLQESSVDLIITHAANAS
jgi:hypothetical protein